jgi:hypothetical protein
LLTVMERTARQTTEREQKGAQTDYSDDRRGHGARTLTWRSRNQKGGGLSWSAFSGGRTYRSRCPTDHHFAERSRATSSAIDAPSATCRRATRSP